MTTELSRRWKSAVESGRELFDTGTNHGDRRLPVGLRSAAVGGAGRWGRVWGRPRLVLAEVLERAASRPMAAFPRARCGPISATVSQTASASMKKGGLLGGQDGTTLFVVAQGVTGNRADGRRDTNGPGADRRSARSWRRLAVTPRAPFESMRSVATWSTALRPRRLRRAAVGSGSLSYDRDVTAARWRGTTGGSRNGRSPSWTAMKEGPRSEVSLSSRSELEEAMYEPPMHTAERF